jgi:cytochrome c-type biogenesis protein CcmH/NrfG
LQLRRLPEAEQAARRALGLTPDNPATLSLLVQSLLWQQNATKGNEARRVREAAVRLAVGGGVTQTPLEYNYSISDSQ